MMMEMMGNDHALIPPYHPCMWTLSSIKTCAYDGWRSSRRGGCTVTMGSWACRKPPRLTLSPAMIEGNFPSTWKSVIVLMWCWRALVHKCAYGGDDDDDDWWRVLRTLYSFLPTLSITKIYRAPQFQLSYSSMRHALPRTEHQLVTWWGNEVISPTEGKSGRMIFSASKDVTRGMMAIIQSAQPAS